MNILVINGKKYGKGKDSLTDSLFNSNGTNDGYYKKLKNEVRLYNMQDKPFATVITHGFEPFIVSCSIRNKGIWYMHSTSSIEDEILGIKSYRDGVNLANYIANNA